MLTSEQIKFYHTNGYIGVEGVLSENEVAELRRVTEEFVDKSRSVTTHTDVFDLEPDHTSDNPRLRRLKVPAEQHPVYDQTMRHPRILGIVSQLIGPNIRQNGNKLNMKSPEGGSPVEWHQDWAFYPQTNDDLLAVGVVMDDMLLENGCLLVIPGSHKGRVYNHHQNEVFIGAVTDPDFDPKNAVPIELKAGGISIHHVRTLHASAPNVSTRSRRLLFYQYCAADAWPLSGVGTLDSFNASMIQGEPTIEPRLERVPVRMPLPPAERGGSIFEVQSLLQNSMFKKV
jgi:phytanoyl-CoA hydroxylase